MNRRMEQIFSKAFTLIELLIVIAVIGILVAITFFGYGAVQNNAHDGAIRSDLQKIDSAFKQYSLDNNGEFPDTPIELASLNLKLTTGSYNTTNLANLYLCYNPLRTEYAIVAMSLSGKRFVLKSESGITEYSGAVVWNSTEDNRAATCTSIDLNYVEMPGGITGYKSGSWAVWTGVALTCPAGFIKVPGNALFDTVDFCVMKYEAKDVGGFTKSEAAGTPLVSVSQVGAISIGAGACSGCHLITNLEWLTIATNVTSVASNWSGGAVGSGYIYSGHNDASPAGTLAASSDDAQGYTGTGQTTGTQRRTLTLSNGEVIWDFAGNAWEWTNSTIPGNLQPGLSSDVAYTWKNWNNGSLLLDGLPSLYLPSYGTPAASAWTSSQGIGQLFSYYSSTESDRAFRRGGTWDDGQGAGIFALKLNLAPNDSNTYTSFRITK